MALVSLSKILGTILSDVWKWAEMVDRVRFTRIYEEQFRKIIFSHPPNVSDSPLVESKYNKIGGLTLVPEETLQYQTLAEGVIKIIGDEIGLVKNYPKQRKTYLRLFPGIPDNYDFRNYISRQTFIKYGAKVTWRYNLDIIVDLYPG